MLQRRHRRLERRNDLPKVARNNLRQTLPSLDEHLSAGGSDGLTLQPLRAEVDEAAGRGTVLDSGRVSQCGLLMCHG